MPRRSAAGLSVIRPLPDRQRLRPPPELGEAELEVWLAIVAASDAAHFVRSDAPLLARYCESVVLARRAAVALDSEGAVVAGRTNPWLTVQEKAVRAMVALAVHAAADQPTGADAAGDDEARDGFDL